MTRGELEGHVALVTGGSRGIGRATCLRLAEAGAAVAVNYQQNEKAAEEVVARIEAQGGRALALQADVSERAAVEAMVGRVREGLGTVDILVNNAGILLRGSLLDHREDDFDIMWRTNVKGVVYCAAAVAPGMIDLGWGRVINLSSNAAVGTALPGTTFYAATKAAVLSLTRRLALELGTHGITVNAVLPGFTMTDMTTAHLSPEGIAGVTDFFNQRSVLGRGVGEPEEIAELVAFLGSERSGFITGQLLLADGGRTDYLSHA
jgi:3-oxoacyl-[acyl-carrier protein] reductase